MLRCVFHKIHVSYLMCCNVLVNLYCYVTVIRSINITDLYWNSLVRTPWHSSVLIKISNFISTCNVFEIQLIVEVYRNKRVQKTKFFHDLYITPGPHSSPSLV